MRKDRLYMSDLKPIQTFLILNKAFRNKALFLIFIIFLLKQ